MALAKLDTSPCPTPLWLPDGHSQTIYSAFLAHHHKLTFVRQRLETPDTDFVDLDWTGPGLFPHKTAQGRALKHQEVITQKRTAAARWMRDEDWSSLPQHNDVTALILFHGLEGSSSSHYAQAIAHYFRSRGWVVVVAHFRGCSGTPNRLARAYHSGDSAEIGFMLDAVRHRLPQARWHAAGISLGGNALLKYLGEAQLKAQWLHACAGISVPVDLVAGGRRLCDPIVQRWLYGRLFLRTMRRKILDKARQFPGVIDVLRIQSASTLFDFDDAYTAPMHGYEGALDYWTRASSKPVLSQIQVPTLILNARNDPFLPISALPSPHECSDHVLLHQPETGGHAGFATGPYPTHLGWLPQRLGRFFELKL